MGQPEVKRQNLDECEGAVFEPQSQLGYLFQDITYIRDISEIVEKR